MKHDLTSLARDVVRRFFAGKTPLNDSISAIAQEQALNEHMVRRLCELANTNTRLQFYQQPGINQAAALFEPADATKIIVINKEPDMSSDYMFPPQMATGKTVVIKEASLQKTASAKQERRRLFELEEKRANVTLRYSDFVEARNGFLREAKNFFREGHDSKDLNKMASFIDGQATLKSIFPHLQKYMGDLGMNKVAMEIEELMNEKIPVTYVMGTHPLVLKYKDCIMTGDRLRNSIVELERAESISEKKAAVVPFLKGLAGGLNPLKWSMGTKLMVGLPVGMGLYGAHAKSKELSKAQAAGEELAGNMSSFDNPEVPVPGREGEFERDVRDIGYWPAHNKRMEEAQRVQSVNQLNNADNGGSAVPSRSLSANARREANRV